MLLSVCVRKHVAAAETSLDTADANTCPFWRHGGANVQAELPLLLGHEVDG